MGLEVVTAPDIANRGFAHPLVFGHKPATPMGHALGFALQGCLQDRLHLVGTVGGLAPTTRRDPPQTLQALIGEPFPPQSDGGATHVQLGADLGIGTSRGCGQYDASAQGYGLRWSLRRQPLANLFLLLGGKSKGGVMTRDDPLSDRGVCM